MPVALEVKAAAVRINYSSLVNRDKLHIINYCNYTKGRS